MTGKLGYLVGSYQMRKAPNPLCKIEMDEALLEGRVCSVAAKETVVE